MFLRGDLGSHHTAIDADTFCGFAVGEEIAPLAVMNDNDARPGWSFTLLSELTHLLLGETGISGGRYADHRVDTFCNNVASGRLLPARVPDTIQIREEPERLELQRRIGEFGRSHNLSHTMVAYRLFRSGRIDPGTFERHRRDFRDHWPKQRDRKLIAARASDGAPGHYVVRRHRIGPALLGYVRRRWVRVRPRRLGTQDSGSRASRSC